jgi:hypothetical protein
MSRKARTGADGESGLPTLREMAATIEQLLSQLRRVAESDLQTRGAGPVERARVTEELEALRVEEAALLARLERMEALTSGAGAPEDSGAKPAPG